MRLEEILRAKLLPTDGADVPLCKLRQLGLAVLLVPEVGGIAECGDVLTTDGTRVRLLLLDVSVPPVGTEGAPAVEGFATVRTQSDSRLLYSTSLPWLLLSPVIARDRNLIFGFPSSFLSCLLILVVGVRLRVWFKFFIHLKHFFDIIFRLYFRNFFCFFFLLLFIFDWAVSLPL